MDKFIDVLWIFVWCIVNYCDKFWPYVRIGNLENSTNKTLIKWYQVLVGTADFYLGRTIRSRTVRPVQTYLAKLSGIIGLLRLSQVSWFSCADSSLQTSATAVQDSETCRARHPMYALLCAMRRRKMKKVCWEPSCCCSCRTRHETTAMMRRASTLQLPRKRPKLKLAFSDSSSTASAMCLFKPETAQTTETDSSSPSSQTESHGGLRYLSICFTECFTPQI